jgi:MGT family glycosyltransferase
MLWEDVLVPLARATEASVAAAVDAFRPDVLVVDQQALAGALIARRYDLKWATFSTTSASVVDALADLPKVKEWLAGQLRFLGFADEHDALSPSRVIVFSTEALVGSLERFPPHYRFVGPAIEARPDATPFPWDALAPDRKKILVSLGTISADRGDGFYDAVVSAFDGAPDLQIVLVAPDGHVNSANMIVRPRVPQLALLPRLDAVICHAGHNTVCETLAHGLPLVVAPIRDDQPVIARQVVDAGCGVRVRYGRLSSDALRRALLDVLSDPRYRAAAERVRDSFRAAGGAARAADLLEEQAR